MSFVIEGLRKEGLLEKLLRGEELSKEDMRKLRGKGFYVRQLPSITGRQRTSISHPKVEVRIGSVLALGYVEKEGAIVREPSFEGVPVIGVWYKNVTPGEIFRYFSRHLRISPKELEFLVAAMEVATRQVGGVGFVIEGIHTHPRYWEDGQLAINFITREEEDVERILRVLKDIEKQFSISSNY